MRDSADTSRVSIAPLRPSDALSAGLDETRRTRELVEALIAQPSRLGPDFVPIRRLDATAPSLAPVLGWKATGRGEHGTEVADTLSLLEKAATLGLVERLDWAFRCLTFDVALDAGLDRRAAPHAGARDLRWRVPSSPRRVVAARPTRAVGVRGAARRRLRRRGTPRLAPSRRCRAGAGRSSYADVVGSSTEATALRLLPRLRPAYVQVDLAAPGRATDAAVRRFVESGTEHGAQIMALGVDTTARLDEALGLGAAYGRGQLLGRASAVPR